MLVPSDKVAVTQPLSLEQWMVWVFCKIQEHNKKRNFPLGARSLCVYYTYNIYKFFFLFMLRLHFMYISSFWCVSTFSLSSSSIFFLFANNHQHSFQFFFFIEIPKKKHNKTELSIQKIL